MPLALGGTGITRIFSGSNELLKAYSGDALVFDRTPPGDLAVLVDDGGAYLVLRNGDYLVEAPPFEAPGADHLLTQDGDRLTLDDGTPIVLDGTIAGLAAATDLDGTEWVFFVQDGTTVKCRLSTLTEFVDG